MSGQDTYRSWSGTTVPYCSPRNPTESRPRQTPPVGLTTQFDLILIKVVDNSWRYLSIRFRR